MYEIDTDLLSIQEARILVETSRDAQQLVKGYGSANLNRISHELLKAIIPKINELVSIELSETKRGCQADKVKLIQQIIEAMINQTNELPCIGELLKDSAGNILKVGVPLGVITSILPAENLVLNALYSIVISIKSGNGIVLVPHPKALKSTWKIIEVMKQICESNGLPKGNITCLKYANLSGISELLNHKDVALILAIGNSEYLNKLVCEKPVIYGSNGATPVFIERTASVKTAVNQVIYSRAYDNGLLPAGEQYLIAESVVAEEVKRTMQQNGAHFLTKLEEQQLLNLLKPKDNQICDECIGKSAVWLAKQAGFTVASDIKVLVSEQNYLYDQDPFINTMKCPVLAFYLEPDWIHACEKSITLLTENNNGHTLAIHSHNQQVINEFSLKKPVGRIIINGPASIASLGLNSKLPLSVILGGFTTGRGSSAKNITAEDLTYVREIAYPIVEEPKIEEPKTNEDFFKNLPNPDKEILAKVLKKY